MTKADLLLSQNIRDILNNGTWDENPRPKYADGTPAHTYFVTHNIRTYRLDKGEFPICTLRPIAWKTGVREILAIYQNQSNKISEFERCGCGWWKDWALEDGTIGKAYPYNLESHREEDSIRHIVKINPRIINEDESKPVKINLVSKLETPLEKYEKYQLLSVCGKQYTIQSLITGEIRTVYRNCWEKIKENNDSSLSKNSPFLYDRNYYNIGYLGNWQSVKNFSNEEFTILKQKWVAMLKRCYSSDEYYGKYYNNIHVHHRWHCFENFLKDVRYLPQYHLAREDKFIGWELDKDYFASNMYSPDTCVFLKSDENKLYRQNYPILVIKPNGEKEITINLAETCRKYKLNYGNAQSVLKGNRNHTKGYSFEKLEENINCVYRYELSRNQITDLINNIKNNPYGRRHMTSFWNWSNIDKKSLVECAYETIWNVHGEYLDMMLIQRSGDMLTASGAGGINEVQYAALLMMVAKATGYKPCKFTHVVANEQIYDRHMEAANELLNRLEELKIEDDSVYKYKFDNLKMSFNPKTNDFYEFSVDDFYLNNYHPKYPQIALPLGI